MATDPEVRVGDRYLHGTGRVTVTAVDGDHISVSVIDGETGKGWTDRLPLPLLSGWVKVGSGPRTAVMCLACDKAEAEPGMLLCFECTTIQAGSGNWTHVTGEGAAALAEILGLSDGNGS